MNQKIAEQKNLPGVYVPEVDYAYPEIPDQNMRNPEKVRTVDIENGYPFLDKSFKQKFRSLWVNVGIHTVVYLAAKFCYGIRFEGRKNLRKSRKLLKNGALTISNHVHRWDFPFILLTVKKYRAWFPALASNLETKDADFILGAGGIPIPSTMAASRHFNEAFDTLVKKHKWIHVFPESCRWQYYQPIRPFKLGAFKMAYRWNYPLIPMVITYRKPSGIWKLLGVKHPLLTVKIGEVIAMNKPEEMSKNEYCAFLRKKCHEEMCRLAGIEVNCWEPEGD